MTSRQFKSDEVKRIISCGFTSFHVCTTDGYGVWIDIYKREIKSGNIIVKCDLSNPTPHTWHSKDMSHETTCMYVVQKLLGL